MPMWTIKAEPVTGAGVDDAMRQYLSEMGWRVLGRAATEAELHAVLAEDPHHDHGYAEIEPCEGHGKADHWYAKALD